MNIKEIEQSMPDREADIQIGGLSIWIGEVVHKDENTDYVVINTPMLLKTSEIVISSSRSDIKMFEFKNLSKGLREMLENIGTKEVIVDANLDESQFGLKLTSDLQGRVKINMVYRGWANEGELKFDDFFDQTYLPPIIAKLETVLTKYTVEKQ